MPDCNLKGVIPVFILLQVMFTITSEQMMLFDTKWYIPTTKYQVFVGGQQPNQKIAAPSNVLNGSFMVQG